MSRGVKAQATCSGMVSRGGAEGGEEEGIGEPIGNEPWGRVPSLGSLVSLAVGWANA
jgi:hypothetical protein